MKGFFQRLLSIDLSNQTSSVEHLNEDILCRYLGGKGLGVHLLLERNKAGTDPLSPEAHVVFALGPASDSVLYGSCRYGIFAKSPLTGFYGESYSGGRMAIPMSRTGYDAIVISGTSPNPVWLEIGDSVVLFHDAGDLWGKDTFATEKAVQQQLTVSGAGVAVIGPAGENLVRFAVVKNDGWRVAGRTGMGAVLGSKKVKAIAFHGNEVRPFADPKGLDTYARRMLKNYKNHQVTQAFRNLGTPMMVRIVNNAGAFPTRYWSENVCNHWERINAESMAERLNAKPMACRTCFMACGKHIQVQRGRHKGLKLEGPEYETIYSFGGLCLIDKIEEIAYLNDLCDRLGIDTISGGNMAAFAIEASRRGKITENLDYGNPDMVADILHKIVKREGVGDLLAQGIRPASEELGLEDIAIHVKGMEPAGYDPRTLKGMGLAFAVSERGACHLRGTFYKPELSGMIEPGNIEGMAEIFLDWEARCAINDCLILCRFYRDFYPWQELAKLILLTTGVELDQEGLELLASRVINNTRRFNLREGLTPEKDTLPGRFFSESLNNSNRISKAEVETLVNDYYRLRGWDDSVLHY